MVLHLFQIREFLGKKGITTLKNNIHPLRQIRAKKEFGFFC